MADMDTGGFQERYYSSADGLTLYARDYQPAGAATAGRLPVICLPGLTRNSRDFHPLALFLCRDETAPRRVIALDSRGRGNSAWDENKANYNLAVETADVISACAAFGIERAIFIGTSRGGLILHLIAATRPDLLEAVILNDIGPVIEAQGLALIRDYLNNGKKPADWKEATGILRENHGASFTALAEEDWREMAFAIYRDIGGKPAADFDPAIAEALRSMDFSQPLPDLWTQFESLSRLPLMLIRGENTALLSKETIEEMVRRHPSLVLHAAHGQGHAPLLHLGNIPAAIGAFLAKFR
ncbi:alpha/beta hydrolase family protein [Rhizobium phaseoli]|uniref:Alpha/beta hydrolase n=1 Tax=Rhizobium phaseoli TaxID=396 RepID=A0A192T8I7_9HYPH|nr:MULTISPECIES: alpha/beta hydrolase [Rhizobium]MDH6650372.1 pimeloyl-ACP methyl ester carboxylesterase [Rhizobium esperanzae]ANL27234.1 alpha/beta hydrolase family protein [Rhizobium phaseoli]ANL39860.1 alpha/beta hydrolase family protein [Rhizobium phaseoli]ANL52563.1 alpha/beta hydrolase family protein [Rhizobium phaseoli]ANL58849.1 alpha/beta hydrolase family protein [Rhizobium phaseoli]